MEYVKKRRDCLSLREPRLKSNNMFHQLRVTPGNAEPPCGMPQDPFLWGCCGICVGLPCPHCSTVHPHMDMRAGLQVIPTTFHWSLLPLCIAVPLLAAPTPESDEESTDSSSSDTDCRINSLSETCSFLHELTFTLKIIITVLTSGFIRTLVNIIFAPVTLNFVLLKYSL